MYQADLRFDRRHTDVSFSGSDEKTTSRVFQTQLDGIEKPDSEIDPQLFWIWNYAPGLPFERFESDRCKILVDVSQSKTRLAVLS